MPRKPRSFSSTSIYHIILRSINQHIIFEEDADYRKFLYILSERKPFYDIDIFAYCLMDNHIHLLIHSSPENLSSFFRSIGTRFARWYNNKYSRSGHLFQDRFHSVAIESHSQYLSTLAYIHNNPIKASICTYASDYPWSSYNSFYGQKNPLITTSYSYDIAGSKDLLQKYFATHVNSSDFENEIFMDIHKTPKHFPTDDAALAIFKSITQLSSTSEAISLTKASRNEYIKILYQQGLTLGQISRLMDVSISTVKRHAK